MILISRVKKTVNRVLSLVLAFTLLMSLAIVSVSAADHEHDHDEADVKAVEITAAPVLTMAGDAEHWFYKQLTPRSQKIYDALTAMYETGMMKDGKTDFDLAGSGISGRADEKETVSQEDITAYLGGDRSLFNDFAAAKDAFDMEHPEAWYVDSSYLSFRTATDADGRNHAYMGIGRDKTYYVHGVTSAEQVESMSASLRDVVDKIESDVSTRCKAENSDGVSEVDKTVALIKYVHNEITNRISYRFETDCADGNGGFIRTTYALVTHEGVCESYCRAFQWILNEMGVPCVPIHGMQISGDQGETHMWTAVQVEGEWYVVDITWDDPVGVDVDGNIIKKNNNGVDGGENLNYFMVGLDKVAADWIPSGVVSSGDMEFEYPDITERSFVGAVVYDENGFNVRYTAAAEMEGSSAGMFTLTFQGKNMIDSSKDGYYMLVRFSGTDKATGKIVPYADWYYLTAVPVLYPGNPYVGDQADGFHCCVNQAEYLEFAITSRAPAVWDPNDFEVFRQGMYSNPGIAYYSGNGTDIMCDTGLMYNVASDYHAPPYVKSIYPSVTQQLDCTVKYRAHIEFDSVMYKPNDADIKVLEDTYLYDFAYKAQALSEMKAAKDFDGVNLKMETYESAWDGTGEVLYHELQGEYTKDNIEWLYACGNNDPDHRHDFHDCGVIGVEYDFQASQQWADDCVCYVFKIEGLVGKESGLNANAWNWVMTNPSCPIAYKSQGIDWNLWGQPRLIDDPNDLDLGKVVMQGPDGSEHTLAELDEKMNKYGYNGKLVLSVEDISNQRYRAEEVTDALSDPELGNVEKDRIQSSSLFEIGFTRICNMVTLKTGQSVRLSIGYPEGYSYEDLGDVTFKAYHFTRCEEGACDKEHEHTGEIISVEELKLSATPYGLVILVDSFSPFELIVLDGAEETEGAAKTLIVTAEEGGQVTMDNGKAANGPDGMITMEPGDEVTLHIIPNEGQTISAIRFDGNEIAKMNDVTIKYEDLGESACVMLDAEFMSDAVVEANDEMGVTQTAATTAVAGSEAAPERLVPATVVLEEDTSASEAYWGSVDGSGVFTTHANVVELDLGGRTLDLGSSKFNVPANQTLVIKNGTITGTASPTINVADGGRLTLENVKVNVTANTAEGSFSGIKVAGVFTMNGTSALNVKGTHTSIVGLHVASTGTANVYSDITVGSTADSKYLTYGIFVNGGTLNLHDGTVSAEPAGTGSNLGVYMQNGVTNIYGGAVSNAENAIEMHKAATLNMSGGSIESSRYGIVIYDTSAASVTGGNIDATAAGISGNGSSDDQNTVVTVSGGKVKGGNVGIYQPQNGTLTISEAAEIEGRTGIGVKSGTVNITGGCVKGIGEYDSNPEPKSGGIAIDGSAIVIDGDESYYGNIKVNVSSGKLESENGHAVSILRDAAGKGSAAPETQNVSPAVSVVGGIFVSKEDTFRALEPDTDVEHVTVTGGIFDHDISRFLTGDDVVVKDANGNWVIADDKEIYVNDNVDGTFVGDYATIQEAIDLVAGAADKDGWTIHVAPGTYTRFAVLPGITHLKITGTVAEDGSKPVVLVNQENDTLHDTVAKYVYSVMNADGYGILVLSNDVTIENLSIQAGKRIGSWGGTVISGAIQAADGFPVRDQRHHETDGLIVRNCDFKGSNVGKGVSTYSDVDVYTIEGCTFSNFLDAIWQTDDDGAPQNIIIHNNTFTDCTAAISLQFYSKNVTEDNNGSIVITNNTVTGGPVSDTLVRILDMNDKAQISTLKIEGNTFTKVDLIQHGLNAHKEVENLLDANTTDSSTIYTGIDDNPDGSYNVVFHTSEKYHGQYVVGSGADKNDDVKYLSATENEDFVAYVKSVFAEAAKTGDNSVELKNISVSYDDSESDLKGWFLFKWHLTDWIGEYVTFKVCNGHVWNNGACVNCGLLCEHSWHNGTCSNCSMVCKHDWEGDTCSACGLICSHNWSNGSCSNCGAECEHNWHNGVCSICHMSCEHQWTKGVCDICDTLCTHNWDNGRCTVCNMDCEHVWVDGQCSTCGMSCTHSWKEGVCETCKTVCTHDWSEGHCNTCGMDCKHAWSDGTCSVCGVKCTHKWTEGVCDICGDGCDHDWHDGICSNCQHKCNHSWTEGVCDICGMECEHTWENGTCTTCGEHCEHSWTEGTCSVCGMPCAHIWSEGVCQTCEMTCTHEWHDGVCGICSMACEHKWHEGVCEICGITCIHSWTEGVCDSCGMECEHRWLDGQCVTCHKNCTHSWTTEGVCSVCASQCSHFWTDGQCDICHKTCEHHWVEGVCNICNKNCEHNWNDGSCTICGKGCLHSWNDGTCDICHKVCEHSWTEGRCAICDKVCSHNWNEGSCTVCGTSCSHNWADGHCGTCGMDCKHRWNEGTCTVCGIHCDHASWTDGVCDNCHYGCKHETKEQYSEYKAPTCTESGKTVGERCTICGKVTTEPTDISATGHQWDNNGHCTKCGFDCKHTHVSPTGTLKKATCTEPGMALGSKCDECGKVVLEPQVIPANGHTWKNGVCDVCGTECKHENVGQTHEYKAPTCTEAGHTLGTRCSDCGKILTGSTEIPAEGHAWENGKCIRCQTECEHDLVTEDKESTCSEAGYHKEYCTVCGIVTKDEELQLKPHTWDDKGECTECGFDCAHEKRESFGETKAPTCTEPGLDTGTKCSVCGMILVPQSHIKPTGHLHKAPVGDAKNATCTEPGITAGEKCQDCNTVIAQQETIYPSGHKYENGKCTVCGVSDPNCSHQHTRDYEPAKSTSCTEDGRTAGVWCTDCETLVTEPEILRATGHRWNNGVCSVCETACEHVWNDKGVCTVCEYTCEHEWNSLTGECIDCGMKCAHDKLHDSSYEATCTTDGLKSVHCEICGMATVGPEVVPATGHQWIDGTCDICGSKCEHGSYETFGTAVEATCTKSGMTEGTRCTICDAIVIPQRETVPTGHRHIVAIGEAKDATCTEPGMTAGEKCQDCDTVITEQEEIPALGHSYKDGKCEHCEAPEPECEHENVEVYIEAKEPTCTADGHTEGTWCVDCHAVIKESTLLEATGHTTTAHKAKEPTCTEEGATEEAYCTVCGEVITPSVSIPKLVHTVEILEAKAPTCTAEGLTQGSRCSVCGEVFVKQETVPAAGHEYEDGKCTVCGDIQENPEQKPEENPEDKPGEPEKKIPHYVVSDTLTHGRLNVDPTLAYPGSEVSVEVIPETGYVVKRIYVAYEMSNHELKKISENKYTFIMPNENAKIYVEFAKALVPHSFKDVAADSWYNSAVTNLFNRDIVKGISETEFSPNGKATRGQVVTMLFRLDGEHAVSGYVAQFSDVKSDAYYAEAVKWAKANNIVNGMNATTFAPEDNITREQLVTILYRYSQYKKYGTSINQPNAVTGFKDASDISDYATPAMRWAAGNKVIKGYDDNTLKPKNDITRAEICSLLDNYITFNNID